MDEILHGIEISIARGFVYAAYDKMDDLTELFIDGKISKNEFDEEMGRLNACLDDCTGPIHLFV